MEPSTGQVIDLFVDNLSPEGLKMALKQCLLHGDCARKYILAAAYEFDKGFRFPLKG